MTIKQFFNKIEKANELKTMLGETLYGVDADDCASVNSFYSYDAFHTYSAFATAIRDIYREDIAEEILDAKVFPSIEYRTQFVLEYYVGGCARKIVLYVE